MTMNDPTFGSDAARDEGLGSALRDRMSPEHVDLIDLADRSLAAGTRLRRRRRVGVALGAGGGLAAAAVSAVVLVNVLAGPQQAVDTPGFASAPSAESQAEPPGAAAPCTVSHVPGGPRVAEKPDGLRPVACEDVAPPAAKPQALPISLDLPGWDCGVPADDKIPCTGPDGAAATIVVRPASDHDAWVSDPDKKGSAIWVSELHDNYFVSVQGGLGATSLADFIDGLTFEPTWKR